LKPMSCRTLMSMAMPMRSSLRGAAMSIIG